MEWKKIFEVKDLEISANIKLYTFKVRQINKEIYQLLDENIIQICEGRNSKEYSIDDTKKQLKKLFENKDFNKKIGLVSEFFSHLFLNKLNFIQEFMYFNLEENSMKKGFDGVYSKFEKIWLMESKSGKANESIDHLTKINEAFKDINDKLTGKVHNNPWRNALSHMLMKTVDTEEKFRNEVSRLSKDFLNGKFSKLEEHNIIPVSTLFFEGTEIENYDFEKLKIKISELSQRYNCKESYVLCISQENLKFFENYLGIGVEYERAKNIKRI